MIRRSKKARKRWATITQLDKLAREACFERDGHKCVRCGKTANECRLQPSHIIGRRHKCVRWDLDNLLSMCGGCHMWWHEYPSLSGEWFRKNWPERHERIVKLYNAGGKTDLQEVMAGFELYWPAERLLEQSQAVGLEQRERS